VAGWLGGWVVWRVGEGVALHGCVAQSGEDRIGQGRAGATPLPQRLPRLISAPHSLPLVCLYLFLSKCLNKPPGDAPTWLQDDTPVRERGPQKSLAAERSFPPLPSEAAASAELLPLARTLLGRAAQVSQLS